MTSRASRIRVGIGGWNFAPWRGLFYPVGLTQKRELEHASRVLSSIEINSTFYRAPAATTYAKWRNETPDGFVFSLKAPRYLVQARKLGEQQRGIDGFIHGGLAELGDRLGPVLWQFAPFRRFDADDLAAFLDLLPRTLDGHALRHVLEVRHASFMCEDYLALTRAHGVATVFTDSPEHPSFADPSGDLRYARLMCSVDEIDTGYPAQALDAWAERAQVWAHGKTPADLPRIGAAPKAASAEKPCDVFIYFISAAKQRNPAAAQCLMARLPGHAGSPLPPAGAKQARLL